VHLPPVGVSVAADHPADAGAERWAHRGRGQREDHRSAARTRRGGPGPGPPGELPARPAVADVPPRDHRAGGRFPRHLPFRPYAAHAHLPAAGRGSPPDGIRLRTGDEQARPREGTR
jgi:hypothetical protein